MIKVSIIPDLDVFVAIRETAKESPRAMRREAGQIARGRTAQRLIVRLATEPGQPHYPIRWKSARQRRAVMAKLRREGNLPYVRTHELAHGWTVTLDSLSDGDGVFIVANAAPEAQYVQGDFAQPYHLDTGWVQAAPTIVQFAPALQDELIDGWYRVTSL